jgi:hypothetical protein
MQLTVADPAVDAIDLVFEAWSAALPADVANFPAEPEVEQLDAQLSLALDEPQFPLWKPGDSS